MKPLRAILIFFCIAGALFGWSVQQTYADYKEIKRAHELRLALKTTAHPCIVE